MPSDGCCDKHPLGGNEAALIGGYGAYQTLVN